MKLEHFLLRGVAHLPRLARLKSSRVEWRKPLIIQSDHGLYCPSGDFYIDAWRPVARNVVTHAHSDHARRGSSRYLAAADGAAVLRHRMGADAIIDPIQYGETVTLNGVNVSLHPAGHLLGSAQIRLDAGGEVWVVSGDYKRQADPTCKPFERVRCHMFITECTFGLPIFEWPDPGGVLRDINQWWLDNREAGRTSLLLAYSLGKRSASWRGWMAQSGQSCCTGRCIQ